MKHLYYIHSWFTCLNILFPGGGKPPVLSEILFIQNKIITNEKQCVSPSLVQVAMNFEVCISHR